MYSISIGMNPNIADIGPFTLNWHGIMTALAVVVGFLLTLYLARKSGITANEAAPIVLSGIVGGIVFARVFHVIDDWSYYSHHIGQAFRIMDGGLAIYGAVLGGAVVAIIYAKIRGYDMKFMGRIADVTSPGMILGMAIGRIGCTINGDAYGTATGLPWGFVYTHLNHSATTRVGGYIGHPYPVYDIIWCLLIFATLMILRRRVKTPAVCYLVFLSMYSVGRLVLSFVRVNDPALFGLQQAQVIGILVLMVCVPAIIYLVKKARKPGMESVTEPDQSQDEI